MSLTARDSVGVLLSAVSPDVWRTHEESHHPKNEQNYLFG